MEVFRKDQASWEKSRGNIEDNFLNGGTAGTHEKNEKSAKTNMQFQDVWGEKLQSKWRNRHGAGGLKPAKLGEVVLGSGLENV